MKDLCFLSATEIAKGLQSGDLKSEQVLESFANRIAEFEETVKAWEHFDKDFILHKASEADDYKNIGRPCFFVFFFGTDLPTVRRAPK